MEQDQITALLEKFAGGATLSDEEQQALSQYMSALPEEQFRAMMDRYEQVVLRAPATPKPDRQLLAQVREKIAALETEPRKVVRWWRYAAAAAVLVGALSAGWYFAGHHTTTPAGGQADQLARQDIAPGGNKAVLTLANGHTVVLDDAQNGTICQQGAVKVIKLNNGELAYAGEGAATTGKVMYNTITTPRGGQYQVILPDGSKVWLNAASSLRFPVSFREDGREVELNGEAYFEIAGITVPNKGGGTHKCPFRVKTGDMSVEVLGTHFNVAGYNDEQTVKTTLTEGSVKLVKGNANTVIRPGDQGILEHNGQSFKVVPANVEEVLAWKNGYFFFDKADIQTVMRQIARWYDVEVIYEGTPTAREFVGSISRREKLSKVLRLLELSHVRFRVEGRKIIVIS
ncbi:FecR family protein [Chitinophaga qingshengii]|uniref:FecR family protein n=1 Tax=Chitinophaga qingshengii TaxID=1569794 RepID=A0ABR7TGX7_9BACT|nr:FecR family protein [Chitinophaga qingshengii]MBC9929738.1 FecR family protein [Chitinophaga qingshengii]